MDEFSYIASTMIGQGDSGVDVVSLQGEMSSEGNHAAFYLDQDSVFQTVLDVFIRLSRESVNGVIFGMSLRS